MASGALTSKIVLEESKKAGATTYQCNIKHLPTYRQIQKEEAIILNSTGHKCPINDVIKVLSTTDLESVEKHLRSEFYNPGMLKFTGCLTEGIFYLSRDREGSLELNDKIATWFTDIKVIGEESVYGTAMAATIRDAGGMVVLKAPKSPHDNSSIIHEVFIGSYVTNAARNDIPNFSYVFGGFQCSPPVVNEKTKEVVGICGDRNGPKVQFVVYENIDNSISVNQLMKTVSPIGYFSILIQILFTTIYGYEKFDWTHYDLHPGNTLHRKIPKQSLIRYPLASQDYYVWADGVTTIIDYGKSHVKYNGKDYGILQCNSNIIPTESFPLSDIYKFLMFSLLDAIISKRSDIQQIVEVAEIFFKYFNNTESIMNAVKVENETYYELPSNRYTRTQLSIYGLLNHVKMSPLFRNVVSASLDGSYPLLECGEICKRSIQLDRGIASFVDYFDLKTRLRGDELEQLNIYIKQNYDRLKTEYIARFLATFNRIKEIVKVLSPRLNYFTPERITLIPDEKFYSYSALKIFKEYITLAAELKFKLSRLDIYIMIGKDTFISLDDDKTYQELNQYIDRVNKIRSEINNMIEVFKTAVNVVRDRAMSVVGAEKMRLDSAYFWYIKSAPMYL